jgi:tetratricopeptide (TPR) repeat protein
MRPIEEPTMHPILLLAVAPSLSAPIHPAQEPDVRARFVELADKGDRDGVVALWKAHPGDVLGVIDADLEGSLAAKEQGAKRDASEVVAQQRRALFGADCALAAGVDPLLADYVSAFAGFDEAAERQFRGGQKAFGEARAALKKKDGKAALAAARDCLAKASPLGDWWGAQMGHAGSARAHELLGDARAALESWSIARDLAHDLQLFGDELQSLAGMARCTKELGLVERERTSLRQAIDLGGRLGVAEAEGWRKRLAELPAR